MIKSSILTKYKEILSQIILYLSKFIDEKKQMNKKQQFNRIQICR